MPRLNNEERRVWILNDEGLYNWYRGSRVSMRQFIQENRAELDRVITNVVEGNKPAHYLAYGSFKRRK